MLNCGSPISIRTELTNNGRRSNRHGNRVGFRVAMIDWTGRPLLSSLVLTISFLLPLAHAQHPTAKHATNRLAQETSPYLLQHAQNPVDWYPWGEEALEKAKTEDKPIFLSIGYSSCHWCHVMERESFMDAEIANFLNENFVCIKVDREERPDVDSIYMVAVQIINRHGGWPLSVFLTPDAKPFFGGTYFPARDNDRADSIGFLTVARKVLQTWQKEKPQVIKTGDQIATILQEHFAGTPAIAAPTIDASLVDKIQSQLATNFDKEWGGFRFSPQNPRIPKFPTASNLFLLLEQSKAGNEQAIGMLKATLDHMAMGGMWDHIGGGFHRYSTDRFWHIPHFEKMLYDNAQLIFIYAHAAKFFQNNEYEHVVNRIATFLRNEMTAPAGGFYTAIDADSEGEEGAFYRWTQPQLTSAVGEKVADDLSEIFWPNYKSNFEDDFIVPLRRSSWKSLAKERGVPVTELIGEFKTPLNTLLEKRNQRERPFTDTKILTSWNGLMIQGLAEAGHILDRSEYVEMASKAAEFLLTNSMDVDGRLKRTVTNGEARLNAYLDDYAFFAAGLLALHRATDEERWLRSARNLMTKQDELFGDSEEGGYFFTSKDHENLIVRGKLLVDNARPSGTAVAAENLIYLAKVTGNDDYRQKAIKTIKSASQILEEQPVSATRMGYAVSKLIRNDFTRND